MELPNTKDLIAISKVARRNMLNDFLKRNASLGKTILVANNSRTDLSTSDYSPTLLLAIKESETELLNAGYVCEISFDNNNSPCWASVSWGSGLNLERNNNESSEVKSFGCCSSCGVINDSVDFTIDPYQAEVNGREEYVSLCSECYQQRLADI